MKQFFFPADHQLMFSMAKLLPEQLIIGIIEGGKAVFWKSDVKEEGWDELVFLVRDTEWLHICWLIECGLNDIEHLTFREELQNLCGNIQNAHSACWQNRALAISKSKGITF